MRLVEKSSDTPEAVHAPADVVATVRVLLPSLRPAEQRVGQAVLADPGRVTHETIDRLAERANTSTATVTRFCRAIELTGFQQLRMQLAVSSGRRESIDAQLGSDICKDDDLANVVAKLSFASASAIQDTAAQLDIRLLSKVIDLIERASRIDLYGAGASGLVIADLQQKLYRIGRIAYAWSEAHMARTGAALLQPGDVAFGFSESGETEDTWHSLTVAKDHGARTVAVTSHPRSTIARTADITLCTVSHEVSFRAAATSSRHAQLAIIDCIFTGLAQRTYEASRKALGDTYLAVHGDFHE